MQTMHMSCITAWMSECMCVTHVCNVMSARHVMFVMYVGLRVCMYVCMCMYVGMYARVYVRTYARTYVCACLCLCRSVGR